MRTQPKEIFSAFIKTKIGFLTVKADQAAVQEIVFLDDSEKPNPTFQHRQNPKTFPRHLNDCLIQLTEYFKGQRKKFEIPLDLQGTPFQKKVWDKLLQVPYGKTCSYQDLAVAVGKPKAFRAIGGANHRNPIPIIVPCHRVIGAKGALTGYGGGLWRKQWLLEHEQENV
jgi:methylated-DNA-[protein]-cysteine S-methyltransferase